MLETSKEFTELLEKVCKYYGYNVNISKDMIQTKDFLEEVDLKNIKVTRNFISNNAIAIMIIAKENGFPLKDIYTAYRYQYEIYQDSKGNVLEGYKESLQEISEGFLETTIDFSSMILKGEEIDENVLIALKAFISIFSEEVL